MYRVYWLSYDSALIRWKNKACSLSRPVTCGEKSDWSIFLFQDLAAEQTSYRIVNGYKVPVLENDKCYTMPDAVKDKLRNPRFQFMDDLTLFFQFYFFTQDTLQLIAADALFQKNWRWNKKISRWCRLERGQTHGAVQVRKLGSSCLSHSASRSCAPGPLIWAAPQINESLTSFFRTRELRTDWSVPVIRSWDEQVWDARLSVLGTRLRIVAA